MADTKLKEFSAGQRFLIGLENGTISVLRWRAESDPDLDLLGIKKFLLLSTVLLFLVSFLMMTNGIQPNIYLAATFFVNFVLFTSVQWFLDIKTETLKMIGFIGLIVASPWIMHFVGESAGINPNFTDIFRKHFSSMGFSAGSDYQFLTEFSLVLLMSCSMMLGSWLIIVTIPSVLLLFTIKLINKVSVLLVNIERQKVQLFFVGVNILVPIWFFAKDRIV